MFREQIVERGGPAANLRQVKFICMRSQVSAVLPSAFSSRTAISGVALAGAGDHAVQLLARNTETLGRFGKGQAQLVDIRLNQTAPDGRGSSSAW